MQNSKASKTKYVVWPQNYICWSSFSILRCRKYFSDFYNNGKTLQPFCVCVSVETDRNWNIYLFTIMPISLNSMKLGIFIFPQITFLSQHLTWLFINRHSKIFLSWTTARELLVWRGPWHTAQERYSEQQRGSISVDKCLRGSSLGVPAIKIQQTQRSLQVSGGLGGWGLTSQHSLHKEGNVSYNITQPRKQSWAWDSNFTQGQWFCMKGEDTVWSMYCSSWCLTGR